MYYQRVSRLLLEIGARDLKILARSPILDVVDRDEIIEELRGVLKPIYYSLYKSADLIIANKSNVYIECWDKCEGLVQSLDYYAFMENLGQYEITLTLQRKRRFDAEVRGFCRSIEEAVIIIKQCHQQIVRDGRILMYQDDLPPEPFAKSTSLEVRKNDWADYKRIARELSPEARELMQSSKDLSSRVMQVLKKFDKSGTEIMRS